MIEHFFKAASGTVPSITILHWGSLVIIYVLAYLCYEIYKEKIEKAPTRAKIISSILKTNLMVISVIVLIMGQMNVIEQLSSFLKSLILMVYSVLLIVAGYLVPLSLIFIQASVKKK